MTTTVTPTKNYLVPSSGKTHAYTVSQNFSTTPLIINFSIISKDYLAEFEPQGAFIDNSQGLSPLIITVQNNQYSFSVPAGATQSLQFPAPENQIHSITGNGQATIVYVDFPVLPYSSQISAVLSGVGEISSDMKIWNGAAWINLTQAVDADATAPSSVGQLSAVSKNMIFDGANYQRLRQGSDADAVAPSSIGQLSVIDKNLIFDGTNWQRKRTPNIYKSVSATAAGATVLWTPAAGKKFRLMKIYVKITPDAAAAAAGTLLVSFLDAAANFGITVQDYLPSAATIVLHQNFEFDLGNGYLSSVTNNVLNVNLSVALTSGAVSIVVCGTEE